MPDNSTVPKSKPKPTSKSAVDGQAQAREVISILYEISTLLAFVLRQNTRLDRTTLSLCVSLIENGVNPEALAAVIKELRRESRDLQQGSGYGN